MICTYLKSVSCFSSCTGVKGLSAFLIPKRQAVSGDEVSTDPSTGEKNQTAAFFESSSKVKVYFVRRIFTVHSDTGEVFIEKGTFKKTL